MRSSYSLGIACLTLAVTASASPAALQAQSEDRSVRARTRVLLPESTTGQDSTALRNAAEKAQEKLEQFRESRIPPEIRVGPSRCDELIGRMCFRFERDEDPIQPEPLELERARRDLLNELVRVHRQIPGDGWVLGQLIFYLGEANRWDPALEFAESCMAERWWCDALRGYVLHERGAATEAALAFGEALGSMPDGEAARWRSLDFLLDAEGRDRASSLDDSERSRATDYLWLLADPLYLVPGNDRLTAHYARRVVVLMREHAQNPFGLEWEADLEQLVVRYGPEVGWERGKAPPRGGGSLTDTRHIIGRHHPKSMQFVPPKGWFADPTAIPADEWQPEKDEPKTGYAAPYALDVDGLHSQVARFRRGEDTLLVVASYERAVPQTRLVSRRGPGLRGRPDDPFGPGAANAPPPEDDPFGFGKDDEEETTEEVGRGIQSAVFLVRPDGSTAVDQRGAATEDVVTAALPNGEYILSLEVWDPEAKHAWRTRLGVVQPTIPPDLASVSDLLVLDGEGDLPESWEAAVPRTLPGVRTRPGERLHLAWEVYGLEIGERASVTIGLTQGRPNLLRRVGQFLRIIEPEVPVVLTWEDAGADQLGTVFRSVRLDLPEELEPGDYTLHVEIELPGRTPMVISRRVAVLAE